MKNKLVVTAVVALTIALLPFSASPAPAPDADVQNRTTVGIRTATDGVPDNRARYEYEILPKKSKQDAVAVYNYSLKPVTVRLLARDATSTPDGEFSTQPSSEAPQDVGAWIALSKTELRLKPRQVAIVPFQVGVPFNATPGDHTGSILVSLLAKEPKPGSSDVVVEHRVGLRVYLRVPGTLKPELAVQDLKASYTGGWKSLGFGRSEVDYTVRNTGNVRLSARQQVEMLRSFGLSSASRNPAEIKELLPGGFVQVHQEFGGTWAVGSVTSQVTLEPAGFDQSVQDVPPVVKETSVFVFPWLLAVILVLFALAVGLWFRRKRRGAQVLAAAGTPQSGTTVPADALAEPVAAGAGRPVGGKRRLTRSALALGASVVLVALVTGGTPAAHAADADPPVWKAVVVAKSGGADDPIELQTSGGCPQPADSILGKVYGKGFPKDGENVIGNTKAGVNPLGPFPAPLVYSMKEFMSEQDRPVALEGTYRFVVTCRTAKFPKSYGDYVAEIRFTSPTSWVAAKPVTTKVGPNVPVDEFGNPIPSSPGTAGSKSGTPAAGGQATPGAPSAQDPASAANGIPDLTPAADSGSSALAYVLIIGGIAAAAVTGFLLWRRSS
ncbi:MAG: hypothetical protein NTV23_13635 [Propionibacteriales bacterium]|nr:hypothetical protein [Propionibacteriales bacterium]